MKKTDSPKNLILVSILALGIHVAAILGVKDMPIPQGPSGGSNLGQYDELSAEDFEDELMEVIEAMAEKEPVREDEPENLDTLFEKELETLAQDLEMDDPVEEIFLVDSHDELETSLSEVEGLNIADEANLDAPTVELKPSSIGQALMQATEQFQGMASSFQGGNIESMAVEREGRMQSGSLSGVKTRGLTGDQLGTIAGSDDFTIDVAYAPRESGSGYVFKLELKPKPSIRFKRITQNVFFLVDRSYSIDKGRYKYSQEAVAKALDMLNSYDTFNIMVFDKKVVRFSEEATVACTPENIQAGKDFILNEKHGGFFASTELYTSLDKIIPEAVADTEVNTAVLFTDGDTFLSQEEQRLSIGSWTEKNAGKVSLFAVAAGKGNNLPLMRLMSQFNKGRLVYADNFDGIDDLVLHLLASIKDPIGKEIIATAVTDKSGVMLYPKAERMPNLYQSEPYVIYGMTNKLEDFHLFIQGKYYDKWLDIKQTVRFNEAETAGLDIERDLTLHLAYDYFDRYLKDGKTAYIQEAKALLSPMKIPMAFR